MTAFLFTAAWERSSATDSALLVLMAIAEAADADGRARIEHRTIARRARIHHTTVARAIRALEGLGEITVETPAAGRRPATYIVKLPLGEAFTQPSEFSDTAGHVPGDTGPGTPAAPSPAHAEGRLPPDDAPASQDGADGTDDDPDFEDMPLPVVDIPSFAVYRPRVRSDAPPPTPVPTPQRIVPSHLPPTDVGAVLAALGTQADIRGPLFWWRTEHRDALEDVMKALGVRDAQALISMIEAQGARAESLRSLSDLQGILR